MLQEIAMGTRRAKRKLQQPNNETSKLRSTGEGSKNIFPKYCMICKSGKPITVNYKKQFPRVLTPETSAILQTSKELNDEGMQHL